MPPTYLGKTPTAANADLDTLPQLAGRLGALPANIVAALAQFAVVPVVANAAARDALIPNPVANQRVQRTDTGFQERYSGGAWIPEGVLRNAGPYVSAFAMGAKGNGVADDSAVVTNLSAAVVAGGLGEWDPGTYLINGNVTLDGHHRFSRGAVLKVAAGKNVSIAATAKIDAWWQIFDTSLGGTVTFVKPQQDLRLEWWGLDGTGNPAKDDALAWMRMFASVSDGGCVDLTAGLRMRFATTVHIPRRADWTIKGPTCALVTNVTPSVFWDGAYGGRCFNVWRCSNTHFEGLSIEVTPRNTVQYFDGSVNVAAPHTLTLLKNRPFGGNEAGRRGVILYRTADPLPFQVTAFVDDHTLTIDATIVASESPARVILMPVGATGYPGATAIDYSGDSSNNVDFLQALNITAASKRVTVSQVDHPTWYHGFRNVVFPDMQGRVIHIPGAGPAGATLTTTIDKVIDGVTFTVLDAASTTVGPVTGTAEPQTGIGAYGASGISTQNTWSRMNFFSQARSPRIEFVRISADAFSNHEFFKGDDNQFYGGDGSAALPVTGGATIAGGSLGTATPTTGGTWLLGVADPTGYRIRIEGAGPAGAVYDGIISAYNAGTGAVTLSPAASTPVVGAFTLVSEWEGICYYLGQSSNAHGHKFRRTMPNNVGVVYYCGNGGFDADTLEGAGIQYCAYVTQSARLVRMFNTIVQNVGTFFDGGNSSFGVQLHGNNIGDCGLVPGTAGGVIARGLAAFQLKGNSFDTTFLDGVRRKVYDHSLITGSGYWVEDETNFSGAGSPMTMAQLGYITLVPGATPVLPSWYKIGRINGCSNIGASLVVHAGGGNAAIRADVSSAGSPGNAQVRAITATGRASADPTEARGIVGQTGSRLDNFGGDSTGGLRDAGVEGIARADYGPPGHEVAAVQASIRFEPTSFNNAPAQAWHLFRAPPPVFLNQGGSVPFFTGAPLYLMRLQEHWQDGTHTPDVRAVWQESANEKNLLNGLTSFGSGLVEKATVYVDIGAGGNATPNAAGASVYRYRIAGAATINAPTNPQKGMRLKLIIFNNTAGAITPTLNAVFLGAGFGAIGAGKSRSREYVYDDVLTKWEPVGAVSEDF